MAWPMKTMRWSRAIGGPRTDWEKNAILGFHTSHPLEGYRRLTFMMLDANIVAINLSSVRLLRDAGLPNAHNSSSSLKGLLAATKTGTSPWHFFKAMKKWRGGTRPSANRDELNKPRRGKVPPRRSYR